MTEYIVSTGPLRTFDHLYDKRLDRFPDIGNFHTIELGIRHGAEKAYLTDFERVPALEWAFLQTFFDAAAMGKPLIYGFRDVEKCMGAKLRARLEKVQELKSTWLRYFTSDDDLCLAEIRHLRDEMQWVNDLYPPREGDVFFYLSGAPFEAAEGYWKNAAMGSMHSKQDPLLRDFFWLAMESPLLLIIEERGTIDIAWAPKYRDEEKMMLCVKQAALKADMQLTFAPSLFG